MKVVTTRSGLAYEGPSIPTESPLEKVDEQNTEEILDKEHSNSLGSIAQIQPSVVPISIPEPDIPRTQPKPSIPYPSRLNDQKLREKATNQMEKFFQIFYDLHFDISFADASLLMPKFASTIKSLLANKDKLFELAKVPLNENCSAMLLKKLPEKLGDPGRSFLRIGRALIDVYGEEITLRVNDESITFNLNQTMRYSLTYDDTSVNRVDVIDVTCEYFVQDILDFQYNPKSSNPTLVSGDSIYENDSCKDKLFELAKVLLNENCSAMLLKKLPEKLGDPEFVQDVLDFQYNPKSSNPTLVSDDSISENDSCNVPIVKSSLLTLTPFGETLAPSQSALFLYLTLLIFSIIPKTSTLSRGLSPEIEAFLCWNFCPVFKIFISFH
nr:reverse transcriptase domain-containing protein [Tanacetum cinerariifolium]